jgi:UDP-N-acetyl-D-glucosamine dehydrogenase
MLVLGIAYKPNVDDDRESPSYVLLDLLKKRGANVSYYDPFIPVIRPSREHGHWAGTRSVDWKREVVGKFDLVLISTNHEAVNYRELANWADCIVDTRKQCHGGHQSQSQPGLEGVKKSCTSQKAKNASAAACPGDRR